MNGRSTGWVISSLQRENQSDATLKRIEEILTGRGLWTPQNQGAVINNLHLVDSLLLGFEKLTNRYPQKILLTQENINRILQNPAEALSIAKSLINNTLLPEKEENFYDIPRINNEKKSEEKSLSSSSSFSSESSSSSDEEDEEEDLSSSSSSSNDEEITVSISINKQESESSSESSSSSDDEDEEENLSSSSSSESSSSDDEEETPRFSRRG